jgi:hypothetical protein
MKRHSSRGLTAILALCAALLVPSLPLLAQGDAAPAKGPKAVVAEPMKDVGTVPTGEKIVQDFAIRNEGTAPLQITEVRPACGCTVAEFDKTVAPGATGKVHAVLDTKTFTGPISKGVSVFTNDPANPQIQLTIKATVEPYIISKPGYARFSVVKGEPNLGEIAQTLWANDGAPFKVLKVDTTIPGVVTSFREATEAERRPEGKGAQWRIAIKLTEQVQVGPLADYVNVYTDHPKQKMVEIPVSGFVRPILAATPPVADFGKVEVKEPLTRSLNLRNFATEPINVTKVEGDIKGIEAKLEPVQAGREYQVRVTLKPELAKGPFAGKLLVHTDSPKIPVLQVDLKGPVL